MRGTVLKQINNAAVLLVCASLSACVPSPEVEAAAAAELVGIAGRDLDAASGALARDSLPYLAIVARLPSAAYRVQVSGYLLREQGCVVLYTEEGTRLTPVLPHGSQLISGTDGNLQLHVGESRVNFGRRSVFTGEPAPASGSPLILAAPVPASCPPNYFFVERLAQS